MRVARTLEAEMSLKVAGGKLSSEEVDEEEAVVGRQKKSLEKAARTLVSATVTELCKCGLVHNAEQTVNTLRSRGKAAALTPATYATIVNVRPPLIPLIYAVFDRNVYVILASLFSLCRHYR
jgi:hypothetical protein